MVEGKHFWSMGSTFLVEGQCISGGGYSISGVREACLVVGEASLVEGTHVWWKGSMSGGGEASLVRGEACMVEGRSTCWKVSIFGGWEEHL